MSKLEAIAKTADQIAFDASQLSQKITQLAIESANVAVNHDHFILSLTIFVLACFVGYYVVWKVTPALHTPLMSVTNAISGIIIVGALLCSGAESFGVAQIIGFLAVILASINIFGGFIVTQRMLSMFRKK
jgi:NAD(P) transhydrogenase subunit alpha